MTHDVYCKNHGLEHKKFIDNEDGLQLTIFRECDEREKTYSCSEDDCEDKGFYYIAYSRLTKNDKGDS